MKNIYFILSSVILSLVQLIAFFFEPTDRRKATKALHHRLGGLICSSPNLNELRAMAKYLSPNNSISETKDLIEILALSKIVSQVIDFIIVTVGAKGVVIIKNDKSICQKSLIAKYFSTEALSQVENVSGAGDCFASGFIHGMLAGFNESRCVFIGFESAKQALFSKNTVPRDLCVSTSINEAEYVMYKIK